MAHFVRLWGPLWTHSAFAFESMNGHVASMIHSRYEIANQLLFSIDVSSILADKLRSVEDDTTLSILLGSQCVVHRNMLLLFPGTYSIGLMHSSSLSTGERRALIRLTGVRASRILTFH